MKKEAIRFILRWLVILAVLVPAVYQQVYWFTHGCINGGNIGPSLLWFGILVVTGFCAGYLMFPVKKEGGSK